MGYEVDPVPKSDNMIIGRSILLQSIISAFSTLAAYSSPSILGLIPVLGTDLYLLLSLAVVSLAYFMPEGAHLLNRYYREFDPEDAKAVSGKSGKQRKARFLYLYGSAALGGTLVFFVAVFTYNYVNLPSLYLLVGLWLLIGRVYWTNAERFREGNEVDLQTKLTFKIALSLIFVGLGITIHFDSVASRFLNPLFVIIPGCIGATGCGVLKLYERRFGGLRRDE
jgi:hypothetical protein